MAVLIRPRSWGQTPPAPGSGIDFGHPLAAQMRGAWNFSTPGALLPNLVTRQAHAKPSTMRTTSAGYGTEFNGSSDYVQTDVSMAGLTAFTLHSRFVTDTLSTSKILVWAGDSAGNGYGTEQEWHIGPAQFSGGEQTNRLCGFANGTTLLLNPFTDVTFAHSMTLTASNGTLALYVDGIRITTGAVTLNTSSFNTAIRIGRPGASSRYFDGVVLQAAAWSRAVTSDQAAWLHAEPWAFLSPPAPRIAYFALDLGVPTITGTGALTGSSGTLAGAGTLTITGTGALTGLAGTLAGAGTETIAGTAALTGSAGVLAALGSETIAGTAALTGSAGVLAALGSATLLRPGTGTAVLSGPVALGSVSAPAAGSLTVTGSSGTAEVGP